MPNGPKCYLVLDTGNRYSHSMTLGFIKTSPFKYLKLCQSCRYWNTLVPGYWPTKEVSYSYQQRSSLSATSKAQWANCFWECSSGITTHLDLCAHSIIFQRLPSVKTPDKIDLLFCKVNWAFHVPVLRPGAVDWINQVCTTNFKVHEQLQVYMWWVRKVLER